MKARCINYELKQILCFLTCLMITMSIFTCGGCGGGTTGTGGTGFRDFQGTINLKTGAPVSNAQITIEETGDSAVTDSNGNFAIETSSDSTIATLLVEKDSNQAKTTIEDLPTIPAVIELSLELADTQQSVKVKSKKIRIKPTPTPAPTQRPRRTKSVPTPEPSPTPHVKPTHGTITPTPVSTKRAKATRTPTATPDPLLTSTPVPDNFVIIRGSVASTAKLLKGSRIIFGQDPLGGTTLSSKGIFYTKLKLSTDNLTIRVSTKSYGTAETTISDIPKLTNKILIKLSLQLITDSDTNQRQLVLYSLRHSYTKAAK